MITTYDTKSKIWSSHGKIFGLTVIAEGETMADAMTNWFDEARAVVKREGLFPTNDEKNAVSEHQPISLIQSRYVI